MRVRIEAPDGTEMEGKVIGGEIFDERLDYCDLTEMFTLRADDGGFYFIQGSQVKARILDVRIH